MVAAARRAARLRREAEEAEIETYPISTDGGAGASSRAKRGLRRALFQGDVGGGMGGREGAMEGDWFSPGSPDRLEPPGQPEGLGSPEVQRRLREEELARREDGGRGPDEARGVLRAVAAERARERLVREEAMGRGDIGGRTCEQPLLRSLLPSRGWASRARREGAVSQLPRRDAVMVMPSDPRPSWMPVEAARQLLRSANLRRKRRRSELEALMGRGGVREG